MKVYVGHAGKFVSVSSISNKDDVAWLLSEAINKLDISTDKDSKEDLRICSAGENFVFPLDSKVPDVLKDGQFVMLANKDGDFRSTQKEFASKQNIEFIQIDGKSLTTDIVVQFADNRYKIKVAEEALKNVENARKLLDKIVQDKKVVYGVSTGFGQFARTVIEPELLSLLQTNLIESHCAGVGESLPPRQVRMMMAVRINVLCKGHSGISPKNLASYVQAFNSYCTPLVPEKGTLTASGDLAPLSHVALGMMGKGKMWSPETGWDDAGNVLEYHGIDPIILGPKEGLALINGTQFCSALGSEAVERAKNISRQADVVTALTVEVLRGTAVAFDKDIHAARPHKGQNLTAKRLRTLLNYGAKQSEITDSHRQCTRVQDAYSMRCTPQVHGIAHDTVEFVKHVLDTELNSATDNPMVFHERNQLLSCGNFHGEYPAKVLDYLAIGIHEISSISERRIERLCNPNLSDLPAFLVKNGGLNSGFMMAHCTAAALVSENKGLCHPSSVDSISTSAAQEDHVSMGGWAARKALKVVEHVEYVVAIELLCACQGIDFHRPLKSTPALESVFDTVRKVVPFYDKDRIMHTDIENVVKLLRDGEIWNAVKSYIEE